VYHGEGEGPKGLDDVGYVGLVCGGCDLWGPLGARRWGEGGLEFPSLLSEFRGSAEQGRGGGEDRTSGGGQPAAQEEEMEQARYFVCKECSTPVPSGHRFCGSCGASVPEKIQRLRTEYFGTMQAPGRARLILIRGGGQGTDGLSYLLQGTEHVAGRKEAQILFPEDTWLSPRHANFLYRREKLVVRDEGSANGVYLRIRQQAKIEPGDHFLCGEQVLRLEAMPKTLPGPDAEQTHFF